MRNLNAVTLTGNLTRDPELRQTPNGVSVADLGLAVNESVKGPNGEWTERANFFNVTVWGGQAESCARYLSKGRPVAITGRLRWESWEKDGEKRSMVKVVADQVQFLGGGQDQGQGQQGGGQQQSVPQGQQPQQPSNPVPQGAFFEPPQQGGDDDRKSYEDLF